MLECPLQSLDGTTVELRSRLWNSTFIEDYALSHMDIVVKASLVLHSPAKNIVLRTPDTDVSVAKPKINKRFLFGGTLLTKAELFLCLFVCLFVASRWC